MATVDAIAAVSEGIAALLSRARSLVDGVPSKTAEVKVASARDLPELAATDKPTVTVLLHRVAISEGRRAFPAYEDDSGRELLPPLPVDLSYMVTAWAADATTQQRLLGWALRTLADNPTLPAALLNAGKVPASFRAAETVDLVWAPLTEQEEADVWQVAQAARRPSGAYVAHMVLLESGEPAVVAEPVQIRDVEVTA